MKQRTYWLLPDLVSARRTMTDLLAAGVETRHIHFAARDGLDLTGLHAANVLQTSDVVHAAKTGLVLGSITGTCAGLLVALFFPIVGDGPQWEAAVVLAVLGGAIGAWSSSMIGISIPSPRLERFESAIAQGGILLMVDVRQAQAQAVASLLQATHPEAHFAGSERHAPALP
jgi:hypothetical protein